MKIIIYRQVLPGFTANGRLQGQIPNRAVDSGIVGWFGAIDPNEGGETSRYKGNLKLVTYTGNGG